MKPRLHVMVVAACSLAACHGRQSMLDPASDQARAIDQIWQLMLWVCGFMLLLVMVFLGLAVGRAWRAREPHRTLRASGHERALSISLKAWVVLIVAGLFVLAAGSFLVDRQLAAWGTREPVHIRITGAQWWWSVQYQSGDPSQVFTTANELHLPMDRDADIEVMSSDVIHSFWIPNLNGKIDLIPGRANHIVLTPRRVGQLRGQCAEFCGLQHAHMALDVTVDTARDFDTWRARQLQSARTPVTPGEQLGAQVFLRSGCAMCHTITGTGAAGKTGPDLTHLAGRRSIAAGTLALNRGNLAGWIADPQSQKPGTNMPSIELAPDELNALVDYLMSLQ